MRRVALLACALCALCALYAISGGTPLSSAAPDIVMYASDVTTIRGDWARVADSSAASSQKMASTDLGWSAIDAPLAFPQNYFEIPFTAAGNTPYRVWVRLRASGNSKWNDAVWLQFSDSLTTGNTAVYRSGTASGLLVNLEPCSACGMANWGWQSGAWWLSQTATVQFPSTGMHTLRIQTREDGVQVDQIVLSPVTYFTVRPGQPTNDSTIVPKPAGMPEPPPGPPPPVPSTPYSGTPAPIPGSVEAEQFDNGGEGIAYHDTSVGNTGGAFRPTNVDLQPASSGGYNVGWIDAGEWLRYSVNVAAAGSYTVQFRVAALATGAAGGTFHLEMNGVNVTGTITIPNTGGWQNWQTVSGTAVLAAGSQSARLVFDSATAGIIGNVDRFQFLAVTPPPPPPPSYTIAVPAGGDLQAAIDRARPGDTITLAPGATYLGGFILRAKSGAGTITIRSAAPDSALPADGVRIGPQYASQLPKIQGGLRGVPAFKTEPGAHHWRLQFLELVDTWADGNIVEFGDGSSLQNTLAVVPHDLIIDRCYIHGDPTSGQKRGIALNSASTSIINSHFSDIKSGQNDAQAIAVWNGPGPYTIVNNYLEASGENLIFGGADPWIPNLVPSDILIRHNHITKQPSWRGQAWTVKNLIELKNAQRVVIDGNIIEYNWAAAQTGHAIVLTPRNQEGRAPWSVVQQVEVTNNVIRHVASGFSILGTDNIHPSRPTNSILIRNNLVLDMSRANWGGSGQFVLTLGGSNITVDHNTIFTDGTSALYADVAAVSGFVFTNNIVPDNSWAVMGSDASPGNGTIAMYYPGSTFRGNIFIGSNRNTYPAGNFYPAVVGAVGFVDPSANFRLAPTSAYISLATDGTAVGANIPAINSAAGTQY